MPQRTTTVTLGGRTNGGRWAYLHRGSTAHYVASNTPAAWCGVRPILGEVWHGDQSSAERLKLVQMKRCSKCVAGAPA